MDQRRLFLETLNPQALALADRLEARFEIEGYPVSVFENDAGTGVWTVSIYVPQDETHQAETVFSDLAKALQIEGDIKTEDLDDTNWVAATLSALTPVHAGQFVVHGSHDRGVAKANQIAIEIDAALAFGTGHHGTTAGCLCEISGYLKRKRPVNALDIGTGTGVLAIAIARAAKCPVLATDIDPVATRTAHDNAARNGAAAFLTCRTAAGLESRIFAESGRFDLIVANILAGPLQAIARDLSANAKPGATIILSGLLPHQRSRIVSAYRQQRCHLRKTRYLDGWMTLVFNKR